MLKQDTDKKRLVTFIPYLLRSYGIAYGFSLIFIFFNAIFRNLGVLDEDGQLYWDIVQKYGLEVFKETGSMFFLVGLGSIIGPFAALEIGGDFGWENWVMYAVSVTAIFWGYKCRQGWIGKGLGVLGMLVWFYLSLIAFGYGA